MSELKIKIVGVVGTAKNTGKTTTLVTLMDEVARRGLKVGLTSIGYDGEEIDNVTLLPKPRLCVAKGSVVATSEDCLRVSQAEYKLIEKTNISTPLGSISIVEVTKSGLIILAGPNKKTPLDKILNRLKEKVDFILIDGAMNRIVPLMVAQGIIFTTGAARTRNVTKLAEEMNAIYEIFSYPIARVKSQLIDSPKNILLVDSGGSRKHLHISSILDKSDVKLLLKELNGDIEEVVVPGIVTHKSLENIIKQLSGEVSRFHFIFSNPTSLLVASDPLLMKKQLSSLMKLGINVSYLNKVPILAITVNPFYPKPGKRRGEFESAYVEADEMVSALKKLLPLPIVNVQKDSVKQLFDVCLGENSSM